MKTWKELLAESIVDYDVLRTRLANLPDLDKKPIKFLVNPYVLSLMDHDDPNCPIRKQFIPMDDEYEESPHEISDELGEESCRIPGTNVIHRYPNRVLFLVSPICGAYCRHCTRKHAVFCKSFKIDREEILRGVEYIKNNKDVQDVLISGGDPLMLDDDDLEFIFKSIRLARPDLQILRVGSRMPVVMPYRLTEELGKLFYKYQITHLNIQVNHPKEITDTFRTHIREFIRNSACLIGNQTVLIRGVNDSVQIMRELCMKLASCSIRPYYVYTMDPAKGNYKWQVSYDRTMEIIEGLRGWISGVAVPTFVVDGIGGLGKMPIQPNYVVKAGNTLMCRNFENKTRIMSFLLSEK